MNEDEYLAKLNLTYEDLTEEERKWLSQQVAAQKANQLTLERLKQYMSNMRESVSNELENEPEYTYFWGIFKRENRKHVFLKARLRNYRLLFAILSGSQRQIAEIESALSNIKPQKT